MCVRTCFSFFRIKTVFPAFPLTLIFFFPFQIFLLVVPPQPLKQRASLPVCLTSAYKTRDESENTSDSLNFRHLTDLQEAVCLSFYIQSPPPLILLLSAFPLNSWLSKPIPATTSTHYIILLCYLYYSSQKILFHCFYHYCYFSASLDSCVRWNPLPVSILLRGSLSVFSQNQLNSSTSSLYPFLSILLLLFPTYFSTFIDTAATTLAKVLVMLLQQLLLLHRITLLAGSLLKIVVPLGALVYVFTEPSHAAPPPPPEESSSLLVRFSVWASALVAMMLLFTTD